MKAAAVALLALATKAIATPVASDVVKRGIEDLDPMEFTGPVFVGGDDVTLSGTAEEVYNQIIELNPQYDARDFPDDTTRDLAVDGPTVENLDINNVSANPQVASLDLLDNGAIYDCDKPPQILDPFSNKKCGDGLKFLRKIAGWCGVKPGKQCARLSCSYNCGMSFCLRTSEVLKIKCRSFANDIEKILKKCEDNEGYSSGRLIHDKHVVEAHVASC